MWAVVVAKWLERWPHYLEVPSLNLPGARSFFSSSIDGRVSLIRYLKRCASYFYYYNNLSCVTWGKAGVYINRIRFKKTYSIKNPRAKKWIRTGLMRDTMIGPIQCQYFTRVSDSFAVFLELDQVLGLVPDLEHQPTNLKWVQVSFSLGHLKRPCWVHFSMRRELHGYHFGCRSYCYTVFQSRQYFP